MHHLSDTAYLVAMYRALESNRPDSLFQDPFAYDLAGRRGQWLVELLDLSGNKGE